MADDEEEEEESERRSGCSVAFFTIGILLAEPVHSDKLLTMEVPNNHNWPRYQRELKLSKQLLKQENGGSLTT